MIGSNSLDGDICVSQKVLAIENKDKVNIGWQSEEDECNF